MLFEARSLTRTRFPTFAASAARTTGKATLEPVMGAGSMIEYDLCHFAAVNLGDFLTIH